MISPKKEIFKYKKVCYFTNWSQWRPKPAYFAPENIDASLCTHIIYAFSYIDNVTFTLRTIEYNDLGFSFYNHINTIRNRKCVKNSILYKDFYKRVNDLKFKNPKLKTLLGVGGWNHPSKVFSDMVCDEKSRLVFIYHALKLLRHYNFDGIDFGKNEMLNKISKIFIKTQKNVHLRLGISGRPRR